jgi:hypothetical protein
MSQWESEIIYLEDYLEHNLGISGRRHNDGKETEKIYFWFLLLVTNNNLCSILLQSNGDESRAEEITYSNNWGDAS